MLYRGFTPSAFLANKLKLGFVGSLFNTFYLFSIAPFAGILPQVIEQCLFLFLTGVG